MEDLPETSELQTFVRAVEAGSLSKAARELGVPRPTVSRRLERLERKLGVRLLRRTTRSMALSDAGEALFLRARSLVSSVRDACDSVQQRDGSARGLLRVSVPPSQGARFGALVASFMAEHPAVRVEIEASTRHVDLVAGGFDVAVRAGTEFAPGLVARPLARSRLLAVASPAYLARAGVPRRPADLKNHPCLAGYDRGEHPPSSWPLLRGGRLRVEPRLASNDLITLREAALRGLGVALLPLPAVYDDLASGDLVPLLPDRIGADVTIAVVFADREFISPAVRAFVDATVRWAATEPAIQRAMPACDEHKKAPRKGPRASRSAGPTARAG